MKTPKFLLCTIMVMSGITCYAQGAFTKALSKLPVEQLPYSPDVRPETPVKRTYASLPQDFQGDYNPMYYDRNLDKKWSPDTHPLASRLFRLPDSEHYLVLVSYDDSPASVTDVLFITDSSAEPLDRLEVFIAPDLIMKDFRIDEYGIITTYQIIPSERKERFSNEDFRGRRQDTVYQVLDGKFIKVKTIDYEEQIIDHRDLRDIERPIRKIAGTITKVTEY